MTKPEFPRYSCKNCNGKYQVVRVEAVSAANDDRPLKCVICGAPLQAYEGKFALKYFLVGGFKKGRQGLPNAPAVPPPRGGAAPLPPN